MAKLYALDLQPYRGDRWRELLPGISEERRRRALACRFDADRARIVGTGWVLQYALQEVGLDPREQKFAQTSAGKPYLPQHPELHFSLSHGGSWAVCAVSSQPVGVDVEMPRCTMQVANRFFPEEELQYLRQLPMAEQRDALNRLWTGREAFLKALGTGLTLPLDSFRIELSRTGAILHQSQSELPYRLHEYRPDFSRICLCTTEDRPDLRLVKPGQAT